ncbi:hypothetical protein PGT21_014459 [Puccinia graminis f. sp. tritici]|uniref:C2H2-type domain-containing protein n=1 Tax=Puccinia graminis f. sp. tritici TaxID=56615 RepID=A0A5B0N234_PUCGR|nr:hypothetical protein PGTUg99_022750 [Puccinia graminis f. sp. tritici]KAA1094237.1 hypothetical protein PGT21_014459 [Puccinia graminis f. sp. tritici]
MSDQGPGNSKSQSNFSSTATEEQLARIRARGDPFVAQDDNEPLSSPPLDLDDRPSELDSSALQGPQQGSGLFDQFPNPEPDIFSLLGLADPTQASSSLADPIQASSSLADPIQASSSLADPIQASSSLADPTQASSSLAVDPSYREPIPTTGHNARQRGGRWLLGILNPSQAASNEQSQGSGPAFNTSAQQPTPQSTSKTPHGLPATSGTAATPATQGPAQPLSKGNPGQKKVPDFWEVYFQRAPGTGAITGVLSEAAMELAFSLPIPSNTGVDSDQEMEYAPALSPTVPTITIVEDPAYSDPALDDREIEEVENLLRGRVDNTLSSRTPIQPLPNPDANIDPLLATLFPEHLRPSTSAPQGPGLELNESDESHDSLFDGPDDDDTSPMADRDPAEQTPDIPLQGGTGSRESTSDGNNSLFNGTDDEPAAGSASGRDPANQSPDIPLQGGTSSRESTSDGNNSLFNGPDEEPEAGPTTGRDPAYQSPDILIPGGTGSGESSSDGNNSLFNGPDEEPEAGPTTGRDPANQSPDILIPGGTGSGESSSDGKNSLFDGSDDEPAVADPSSVSTASGALSRDNPPPPPAPRGPPLPHTTRDGLRLPGPGKPGASTVPAAAPLPSTTRPRRGVSPLPAAPSQNTRTASALPNTTRAAPQPYTTRDGLMLPGPGRRGVSPLPAAPSQNTRTASALPNTTRAAPQPFTTSDGLMLPGPGRRGASPLPAAPSQNTRTASALPNTTRAAPQPFTTRDGLMLPGPGRRGVSPLPAAPSQNTRTASALPNTTRAAPQPFTTSDGLMLPGPGRRGVSPLPAAPSQNTRTASALPNTTRAAPQPFTTSDGLRLPGPGRRGVSPLPAAPSQNTRTASALPNTTRAAPQPFTTSDGLRLPGPGRRGVSPIPAAVPPTTQRTTRRTVTPQPPATTSQRVTEHQPQSSQLASNTTIPQPPAQSTSTQPAQSQQGPSQGQRVTKGPRGPCPICGKDLAISSHRSHLASVHGLKEKPSCKFCGFVLRHAGDLPRHVRSKHPEIAARMAAGEKLRDLEPSAVHTNQTNQPTTNQSAGQGSSATADFAVPSLSLDIPVDPRLSHDNPVPSLSLDIPVPSLSLDIPVPSLSLDIPVPSLSLDIPVPSLVVPGGPATRRRSPRTTPAPEPIPGTSSLAPVASTSNAPPAKRARTRAQTQADDDNDPVNSKTKKGKGPAVEVSTTEDGSSVVTLRPKVTRKRNPEGTTKPRAGARQVQCPDCEEWGTFKNRNRHAANCAPRLLRIAAETPATQPLPQKKKVTCQICKKQLAGDLPRHMRSVHPQHPSVRWEEQEQDDDDEVDDPQQGSSNPKRKKKIPRTFFISAFKGRCNETHK